MPDQEPVPYLRANIQAVPYWNPTAHGPDAADARRLDLNECPYPPSPKVLAAIADRAAALNRYPDGGCPALSARIAERTGVPAECIAWGTGSTELLSNAVRIAIAPGDNLVAPTPLWRRFAGVFQIVDADATLVPNRADGGIDTPGMAAAVGNRTRLVVCVTPNNPTGMMLSEAELRGLSGSVPENVLLYVDEAYQEFAVHAGGPDALDILRNRRGPWLVTRTFSKAYALAGLRLGYALCSEPRIANALSAVTSVFNMSGISEAAAMAALDDPGHTQFILDRTAEERRRTMDGMRALGLDPLPSVTNFVSVRIPLKAAEAIPAFRERGVRIAGWGEPDFDDYIRVSMGLPEDTDAFLAALGDILGRGSLAGQA